MWRVQKPSPKSASRAGRIGRGLVDTTPAKDPATESSRKPQDASSSWRAAQEMPAIQAVPLLITTTKQMVGRGSIITAASNGTLFETLFMRGTQGQPAADRRSSRFARQDQLDCQSARKRDPYRHAKGAPFITLSMKPLVFLCSADKGPFLRPSLISPGRRAQSRSSMAAGHRRAARSVLDGGEHGAMLEQDGVQRIRRGS
jgi:hypothetical protein